MINVYLREVCKMMRIDKFLSQLQYGTRNEIAHAINDGLVKKNHELVKTPKLQINPELDVIEFDNEVVFYKETLVLMVCKPHSVVSANKDTTNETVTSLIKPPYNRFKLNIAGRLDMDTEGLLILTNKGKLLHDIISPNKEITKKYYVELEEPISKVSQLEKGVDILDGKGEIYHTKPAKIEKIDEFRCFISVHEGKYHQVKRMFQSVNNKVLFLKRVAIGGLLLDESLLPGEYRELTDKEIELIFAKTEA